MGSFAFAHEVAGLAWDGEYLWMAYNDTLVKVDTNGKILQSFKSPVSNLEALTWDGATFWIFDSEKDTIHQFTLDESGDFPHMQILKSFAAPQNQDISGTNDGLVWGDNGLLYSDRYNIYKLNREGSVLNTIKLPHHIRALAWDGEHRWLAYDSYPDGNTLAKIDAKGNTLLSINSGVYTVYDLAWGDGYIWVLGDDRDITNPLS